MTDDATKPVPAADVAKPRKLSKAERPLSKEERRVARIAALQARQPNPMAGRARAARRAIKATRGKGRTRVTTVSGGLPGLGKRR